MRMKVISPGGSASNPMAMNRNDDPQMPDTARKSAQSCDVNSSSLTAFVAVNSLRPVGEFWAGELVFTVAIYPGETELDLRVSDLALTMS